MSEHVNTLTPLLAARLRAAREVQGWSLAILAARSGVSRAMISKVERAEASPTAELLGRLSGALGITLSALLAQAEGEADRIVRRDAQPVWVDPATGYVRRSLSPPGSLPLDLVEVDMPAGAKVAYPASALAFRHQQVWLLRGRLRLTEGGRVHVLAPGDCLRCSREAEVIFENPGPESCGYLVALVGAG